MSVIDRIRKKILSGEYEFSIPHFFEEMIADQLSFSDIKNAILKGRINRKLLVIHEEPVMRLLATLKTEERLLLSAV